MIMKQNQFSVSISIPSEYCTSKMLDQLKTKGITSNEDVKYFNGKQVITFLIGSLELFASGITIIREFVPKDENVVTVVIDEERYKNINLTQVDNIFSSLKSRNQNTASFPLPTRENLIFPSEEKEIKQ